jgi:hypothetical protein
MSAGSGPLNHLSDCIAHLRDFSPFAFASPALEKQYQDYQSAHVGSHVGIACWLLGLIWIGLNLIRWHHSLDYPRLWLISAFPVALCFSVGCFSSFFPALFRRHWQACAFAIITLQMLLDDKVHVLVLLVQAANGKQPSGTLIGSEFHRLLSFMFFAVGFPLSVPAWGLAHVALLVTADYLSAGRRQCVAESMSFPWPVSSALESTIIAYLGQGAYVTDPTRCQVWVMFWRIQGEVMGGVVGVLRDVAWRRSFLRAHPDLIGHDGAARAAAWPFGSPRTLIPCAGLVISLFYVEAVALDFRVSAILRSDRHTIAV